MPICLNKYFSEKLCFVLGGTHRRPSILKGYADEKRLKTPALVYTDTNVTLGVPVNWLLLSSDIYRH